jgi:starch phosphorylase
MNETAPITYLKHALPGADLDGFDALAQLALDMHSTWNHEADPIWQQLDPALWGLTQNPWALLQTVSREKLQRRLLEPAFRRSVDDLLRAQREAAAAPAWFQKTHPRSALNHVAYFCMEFMLSEALPIYSGGLGNVAGDQLKAASDLGVPVIGVGLLYQQGYFRQVIDREGAQQALYPYNDPGQLPITPLRQPSGEWLRLEIALPGYSVWLRAWEVQVGRVKLYLLDSNDVANYPAHRGITSSLYGGDAELRLKQELLLGIGGWRLLGALGIEPEVCHLNEGHAAFAVLERARGLIERDALSFEAALSITRAGNLFTTHTAVSAGFDRFEPALIAQYLQVYAETRLGITLHDLLALGRADPNDESEPFNMAYLAVRGSGAVNGVSQLHGVVSRHLFRPLFPRWPEAEVPIGSVTNGVHMSSWDSGPADELWTQACGKSRWLGKAESAEEAFRGLSDARLWQFRSAARVALIEHARERLARQLAAAGASAQAVEASRHLFDPDALTLGFARRFATYKRPNLLLSDPERLLRLLTNPTRRVQIIIAGKAHPADLAGQALVQQWVQFSRRPEARPHAIFLSDYDMHVSELLVQGVDVWINTPRRPWEACGTSGMKVLVNGGINLSELDGWWAEAYESEFGWALGDGQLHGDAPEWDEREAQALYDLLEQQVIPEFYTRDSQGISAAWVQRMRASMGRLTPRFSANRAVCEYAEEHYLPAAVTYRERAADLGQRGLAMLRDRQALAQKWGRARFGELSVKTQDAHYLFEVAVFLGELEPDSVTVELYAEAPQGPQPVRQAMDRVRLVQGTSGADAGHVYGATVAADRPASDFTPRLLPHINGAAVPLEESHILWQR